MAKASAINQRLAVGKDSNLLAKEVDCMESVLHLQKHLLGDSGTRGMLRKEIGGSRWQHGGEGKVLGYKSTKDLDDRYGIQDKASKSRPGSSKKKAASSQSEKKKSTATKVFTGGQPPRNRLNMGPEVHGIAQNTKTTTKKSAPVRPNKNNSSSLPRSSSAAETNYNPYVNKPSSQPNPDTRLRLKLDIPLTSELSSPSDPESDHLFDPNFLTKSFEERTSEMRSKVLRKVISKIDKETLETSLGKGSSLGEELRLLRSEEPVCDSEVYNWLKSLNLKEFDKYARTMAENEMDIESLKLVTENQLKQMGITGIGPMNKMLFAIKDLRGENSDMESYLESSSRSKTPNQRNKERSARTPKSPLSLDIQGSNIGGSSNRSTKSSSETPRERSSKTQSTKAKSTNGSDPSKGRGLGKDVSKKIPIDSKSTSKSKTTRPVSGSVLIPNRKTPVKRPNSAAGAQPNTYGAPRREVKSAMGRTDREKSPDELSPLDERDLNVSDFISVRTMVSDVPAEGTFIEEPVGDYLDHKPPESGIVLKGNSPLDRLTEIEAHIAGLQEELQNPLTMDLIGKLQSQLQEVQSSLVGKRIASLQPTEPEEYTPPMTAETLDDFTQAYTVDGDMHSLQQRHDEKVDEKKHSAEPGHKAGVASLKMSKTELLKEVRKQKDLHRKQIRHLESELSRLKYKDPLRSCEIHLEDFTINENGVLGEGAFSQVFHGFYQGSEVAIKRLKIPLSSQDKNYFAAEVSLLRELRHPRVVLLLGVNTTSTLPLMILEYMSGGSLYHHLHDPNSEGLDHAAFYQVARDTALGLNYLHRHRPVVLHLDLKSMNVLLTGDLRAKIGDFGFSKLRHDAELTSKDKKLKGTPAWMSPELLDTGEISTKADVYSFAIILWEMVTRRRPYEGLSMFQVIQHTRTNKRPDIPADCPEELRHLIMRCWEHNPAKRPSFKDIVADLERTHFPQEWRILFTVSGVPTAALDDVEATRSLINLVYDTMDGQVRPDDVPMLDLNDSQGSNTNAKIMDFSSSDSSGSEGGILGTGQISGKSGRSGRVAWSGEYEQPAPSHPKPIPSNFTLPPPPPVPPLDMNLLFTSPENQLPTRKTTSFLDDLKSGVKNLHLKPSLGDLPEEVAPKGSAKKNGKGSGIDLRASQLLNQRGQLRTTEQPHPNQLRNLQGVSEAKLHDLAEVLRKAVSERRVAMFARDGNSIDQTLTNSGWSVTDM